MAMPDYTKAQYNALIHAIWRIDQMLKSPEQLPETRATLERDRQALQEVFIGQFQIRGA
jgi:hypothetical protein